MKTLSLLSVALALVFLSQPSSAQSLAKATSVRCTFPLMSSSSLHGDVPKAEIKPPQPTLVLQFTDVNTDEGTAQLKGVYGAYDIVVRYAQGYLNFIQSFRDGPVHVTTILEQKTKAGKLKAMHSRHEFTLVSLPGFTSSPEQYYGDCEILTSQ